MKLLKFIRVLATVRDDTLDVTDRAIVSTPRVNRATDMRCVWSPGAGGGLGSHWPRDRAAANATGAIPATATRRFPLPELRWPHLPMQRTPTPTHVTDFRRPFGAPAPKPRHDLPTLGPAPHAPTRNDHVQHARPL